MNDDYLDPDRHLWPPEDEYHCYKCGKPLAADIEEGTPQDRGYCSALCEREAA